MHEIAMANEILTEVLEIADKNHLRRVTQVKIALGAATCLQADSLRWGIEMLAKGTLAEAAEFAIHTVAVAAHCRHCGWSDTMDSLREPACPECGVAPFHFENGKELNLQSIEGEE